MGRTKLELLRRRALGESGAAAKPDAVLRILSPAPAGIQFSHAIYPGPASRRRDTALQPPFVIDALSLPRLGELALGIPGAPALGERSAQ